MPEIVHRRADDDGVGSLNLTDEQIGESADFGLDVVGFVLRQSLQRVAGEVWNWILA